MKIINTTTGEAIAEITTNHSMSIDEAISLMGWTVEDDGELTSDGESVGAYYEDLEMEY